MVMNKNIIMFTTKRVNCCIIAHQEPTYKPPPRIHQYLYLHDSNHYRILCSHCCVVTQNLFK
jgi:hypothetical protein